MILSLHYFRFDLQDVKEETKASSGKTIPKANTFGDSMKEYRYTVFFQPLEEGGYNVVVPAIPEICTFGETLEEARTMAADAIRCYLESAVELGEKIPGDVTIDQEPVKEHLAIAL